MERHKQTLIASIASAEAGPVLPRLHGNLPEVYRNKVAKLRQAFGAGGGTEVLEAARALVERVEVQPAAEAGGQPRLELIGALTALLRAAGFEAQQQKGPSPNGKGPDLFLCSAKGDAGMLYGWKAGSQHYWCGARDQGNVWHFDKPARNDLHPTMKPVALVERAIRNSSKPRDTVLDCFGGSGTTMIAAERTGRRAVLLEIDPAYADVIVWRWQEATGEAAVLEGENCNYNEIKLQRSL